ncbi:deoxycytidyl transferase [Sporothrix bragantina]|uniref:Deoxycytidyl transferase n=1 Tax=Sporothrix bragantina TaxID=671064 RepID=A0ABP0CVM0_9PEZI
MANLQRDKNAAAVRKQLETRKFEGEEGEEYGASRFGEFGDYFRRKKVKLQNEDLLMRQSVQGKPQIFKGITIHVASYTQPAPEELRRMLVLHGAQYIKYLDYKTMVTHIVASTLPPKKADEWRRLRVVRPAWVVDSIAAGRLLPWSDYRLIHEGPGQKRIQFNDKGQMAVQAGQPDQMAGYREQSKDSYYAAPMQQVGAVHDRMAASSSAVPNSIFGKLETMEMGKDDDIEDDDNDNDKRRKAGDDLSSLGIDSDPHSSLERDKGNVDKGLKGVEEGPNNESFYVDNGLDDVDLVNIEDTYMKELESKPQPERKLEPEPYEDLPPGQDMRRDDDKEEGGNKERDVVSFDDDSPNKPPSKPMTSEEHNALLLADPKIRKASTANPDFLKQFYSESRLHHLSTWKAELKSKMQRMAAEKGRDASSQNSKVNGKTKKRTFKRRYIMHVDFDSFFCAVSLKSAPAYIDKPAVVAHSSGEGSEIASCNYAARAFGVKNGMWMRRALELCPDLKVLPYDFPAYEEASARFYEAILDIGDGSVVQSVSVDEALVDVTALVSQETGKDGAKNDFENENENKETLAILCEQDAADTLATSLRSQIKASTGCNVSVGIGGNILLAKVALRRAKPAGQYQIRPDDVLDVLGELTVEQLPGVAYSIGGKLKDKMGVQTVRDLRALPKDRLVAVLGPKTAERLFAYARGIDNAAVGDQPVRKSVSAEVNWGIRFTNQDEADAFVLDLCKELERRLLHEQVRGRSLTVKILRRAADAPLDPEKHLGHGKCDVFNKSVVFGVATHNAAQLGKEALSILKSFRFSPGDLRGLGVQLQKLEPIKEDVADSSQKKLSFGAAASASSSSSSRAGAAGTATATTAAPRPALSAGKAKPLRKSIFATSIAPLAPPRKVVSTADERDEVDEPQKRGRPDPPPALAMAFPSTQFFMPANPDPSVLAELPPDIIRRLVGQQPIEMESGPSRASHSNSNSNNNSNNNSNHTSNNNSRNQSPAKRESRAGTVDELPPDIDPEVFEALPADMRAEVLAEYRRNARQQSNSPAPSPRRDNKTKTITSAASGSGGPSTSINSGKKGQSPVKRGIWGTRGLAAAAAARERRHDAQANRVQTSIFVPQAALPVVDGHQNSDGYNAGLGELEELDLDVLAALPDDMRHEVLEDYHRRREQALQAQQAQQMQQMQQMQALRFEMPANRGRIGVGGPSTGAAQQTGTTPGGRKIDLRTFPTRQRPMLQFPPPPPKMSFRTTEEETEGQGEQDKKEKSLVLSLADTKKMLKTWHTATRDDGPHETDVEVLERYLAGVVAQERNMDKARKLVVWLEWLVGEGEAGVEGQKDNDLDDEFAAEGVQAWRSALERVKEAVQEAMQSRGLPPLQFD